ATGCSASAPSHATAAAAVTAAKISRFASYPPTRAAALSGPGNCSAGTPTAAARPSRYHCSTFPLIHPAMAAPMLAAVFRQPTAPSHSGPPFRIDPTTLVGSTPYRVSRQAGRYVMLKYQP